MLTLDLPGTSQDIAYSYDSGTNGLGRLTNIADPSGTLAYQYDKRRNLTQEQKTMVHSPLAPDEPVKLMPPKSFRR